MKSAMGDHLSPSFPVQEYDVVVQGQSAEKVASEIVRLSASCFMVTGHPSCLSLAPWQKHFFHVYFRQLTLQQRASAPSILDLMMIFLDRVVRTARTKRTARNEGPTSSVHHRRYQHPRYLTILLYILDQYTSIRHLN